jgi:2-haloacid dehalogenase
MPAELDPAAFDVLTFDCYGTLIDWESGLLTALRAQLGAAVSGVPDDELLEAFGAVEHAAQSPYQPYRAVLAQSLRELGTRYGVQPTAAQQDAFGASVGDWPAFPDSADALAALQQRYRLVPITNCDDDLFAGSAARLGITFDDVITAQQAGAYKPDERPFLLAFERLGVPRERILHVAQSLWHDHVTAKRLGLTSVWINRRAGRPGAGATPVAHAAPDLELPDLRSLARLLTR